MTLIEMKEFFFFFEQEMKDLKGRVINMKKIYFFCVNLMIFKVTLIVILRPSPKRINS